MSRHPWKHWSQRLRDEQNQAIHRSDCAHADLPSSPPQALAARSRPKRPKPIPNSDADHVVALCREGRLFELEHWIAEGKSIEMPLDYKQSPLKIAVHSGFHSLVELLLRHESSQARKDAVLGEAVWSDKAPLVELSLRYGASSQALPLLDALLHPKARIAGLLIDHGADPIADYPFPRAFLAGSYSALRTFIDCRRERPDLGEQLQAHLDMALRQACSDGRGRMVGLLTWAGANPRARGLATEDAIDITRSEYVSESELETTAVQTACVAGSLAMLRSFRVSPELDDLSALLRTASYSPKPEITRWLLRKGANPNDKDNGGSTALDLTLQAVDHPDSYSYSFWDRRRKLGPEQTTKAFATFKALTDHGAFWRPDSDNIKRVRRSLLQLTTEAATRYLDALKTQAVCAASTYAELIRTPAIRAVLRVSENANKRPAPGRRRDTITGAHRSAKREPSPRAPVIQTQAERTRAAALERYRQQLYEEVWSFPTQKVAAAHGVSDVAIAKTCKRLKIPKPPRGYWNKKAAGLPIPDRPALEPTCD